MQFFEINFYTVLNRSRDQELSATSLQKLLSFGASAIANPLQTSYFAYKHLELLFDILISVNCFTDHFKVGSPKIEQRKKMLRWQFIIKINNRNSA